MQTKIIASAWLITGFNTALAADTSTNNITALPDTVVTATRSETDPKELATAITVYTRKDIERLQVRTLPDLFKGSLGLDVAQSGGYGQPTSLFMRGSSTSQVLVLLDGIKIGSATTGTTPFELIPIDQIERVEIIRGPQSSLYGSEAVGGVIQIFTRKGSQSGQPKVTLDAGGGSYDTAQTAGTVSGKLGGNWYNLGVSHLNSQGFDAQASLQPNHRDGYQNTAMNARFGHRFDNNAEVEGFLMHSEGTNRYNNFWGGADNSAFVNQAFGLAGAMDVSDKWRSNVRLGHSQDDMSTFLSNGNFAHSFNTTRWNASWLNQVHLSDSEQATLGGDYRLDEVQSNTAYTETSRYDAGIFAELHSQLFDHHFVNSSVRWDTNQAFGDFVTGNIGWRYNSAFGISPFARFGNAFKAPTFNDLYYPGFSNPNLKPEQSRSYEIGLAGGHAIGQWELRAYHTDADNLIGYSSSGFIPVNIDRARIEGLEAQISTDLLGWHQQLNGSLIDPVDAKTGQRLQRRATKTLSYDVSRSIGEFDIGAKVLAQDSRPDINSYAYPSSWVNVAGYVTVDLRTAWHINKNWVISGKINNLFNEIYQTVYSYNMADRNFFMTVHYNN